jgi:hypothetical protein
MRKSQGWKDAGLQQPLVLSVHVWGSVLIFLKMTGGIEGNHE